MKQKQLRIIFFLAFYHIHGIFGEDFIGPAGKVVSEANRIFTSALYEVTKSKIVENFVISPFSLGSALAMLRVGAGGSTANELHEALGFRGINETTIYDGYSDILFSLHENIDTFVKTSNRIYVTNSVAIKPKFLQTLKDKFITQIVPTNFVRRNKVAEDINTWVDETTLGKITEIISPDGIQPNTLAIVVNVIYFHGKWNEAFDLRASYKGLFLSENGDQTPATFMEQEGEFPYTDLPELMARAISMPYEGNRFSLIVILPNEGVALSEVDKRIERIVSLSEIPMRMSSKNVKIIFPKFKLETEIDFVQNGILNKLGIKSMLIPRRANFSGISSESQIHIDSVIQKCYIDITEMGTEVAGATFAKIVPLSLRRSITFTVNRSFTAYIYDRITRTVLFVVRKMS